MIIQCSGCIPSGGRGTNRGMRRGEEWGMCGGVPVAGDPYAVYKNDANLVALYLFELAGADIGDDYTMTYDLTQNGGGPDRVQNSPPEGSYNASYNSADSEYLSGNGMSELTGDYSFCGWFYIEDVEDPSGILENGSDDDGFGFRINWAADNYYWQHWASENWGGIGLLSSGTAPSSNTWTHVCITHEAGVAGNDTFIYLNGNTTPDASADWDDEAPAPTPDAFKLGYEQSSGLYLNGDMDEVAVFSRVLSANEINSIYTNGIQDP